MIPLKVLINIVVWWGLALILVGTIGLMFSFIFDGLGLSLIIAKFSTHISW